MNTSKTVIDRSLLLYSFNRRITPNTNKTKAKTYSNKPSFLIKAPMEYYLNKKGENNRARSISIIDNFLEISYINDLFMTQ